MNFYSQQGEDQYLYNNLLNYKDGFFIELGAMDGITYSNTLFFEESMGWSGILIEPTVYQYNQLIHNRPNCHNFNYAIHTTEGSSDFFGDHALGGLAESMSERHKRAWNVDHKKSVVQSIPIKKLIKNIKTDLVDLFSIDVEGGEVYVLETFDWKIPVYTILIEGEYTASEEEQKKWMTIPDHNGAVVNQGHVDRTNRCTEILLQNNFKFYTTIGNNEIWINHDNKRS
jgi:FkbM family methyltransferase